MVDYIVYGVIALIAIGPSLLPYLQVPLMPAAQVDWRQPWVARLMELQRILEEQKNDTAAKTTKKLLTEVIYDGKVV
jgi:hypothetical protein